MVNLFWFDAIKISCNLLKIREIFKIFHKILGIFQLSLFISLAADQLSEIEKPKKNTRMKLSHFLPILACSLAASIPAKNDNKALSSLSNLSGEANFLAQLDSYCAENGALCGAIAAVAAKNQKVLDAAVEAQKSRDMLAAASEMSDGDSLYRTVKHPEGDLISQLSSFSRHGGRLRDYNRMRGYGFNF